MPCKHEPTRWIVGSEVLRRTLRCPGGGHACTLPPWPDAERKRGMHARSLEYMLQSALPMLGHAQASVFKATEMVNFNVRQALYAYHVY